MAYSVLTEQELLNLAERPDESRRDQVERAFNEAESRGWLFVGVDHYDGADAALHLPQRGRQAAVGQYPLDPPTAMSDSR